MFLALSAGCGSVFDDHAEGNRRVVMPLEGLWWADAIGAFTSARDMARGIGR